MVHFRALIGVVALGGVALAAAYSSVDITIQGQLADGRLGASATASPVLGAAKPTIKNGVAYVGLNRRQGSYAATLSTRVPTTLHLDLTQGTLRGSLTGVPLRGLTMTTALTDVELVLPAASFRGKLSTRQGTVTLTVPANVGVQFNLQKFKQGTLTIGGEEVVDTLEATGTYATPNYAAAKFKIGFDVVSELTDIDVIVK